MVKANLFLQVNGSLNKMQAEKSEQEPQRLMSEGAKGENISAISSRQDHKLSANSGGEH